MSELGDADLIPISALNHFLFCPRRCALIHLEGVFEENRFTLEGSFAHERVDDAGLTEGAGVRVVRAMPLRCRRLGLSGKADLVELRKEDGGLERPYPVDFKRGARRAHDNDDVQLCAQAFCLEEGLGVEVTEGAIFHHASRRRRKVAFTPTLRAKTEATALQVRALFSSRKLPQAVLRPACDGCSLREACMPELVQVRQRLARASRALFETEG